MHSTPDTIVCEYAIATTIVKVYERLSSERV